MNVNFNPINDLGIPASAIGNDVKMVIWDLDDTFWNGTLAEGTARLNETNVEVVRTLAARGILSSIASKNEFESAKQILESLRIWDYFVFPSISYDPKGKRVAEIIENASLRAENILFIDDNFGNLEEVRFFNPGIMVAPPTEIPKLLRHLCLTGNSDPTLKRLKQYQLLQRKFMDRQSINVSNEDFLRASEIKVRIDFDVESKFDRVIDLVNRSNQLNYTKKRLVSADAIEKFRVSLNDYGIAAGCISCSDRYGDYGIIGFYMLERTEKKSELRHFVFSCRTMNMGIENFVYDYLKCPEITVVPEVAYGLDSHKTIDWISVSSESDSHGAINNPERLLLVGGCELQQLSSFFGPGRVEFVNKIAVSEGDDYIIRYDDPSFFTADRRALRENEAITALASWTYEDALLLDENLGRAEIIILGMRAVLRHQYIASKNGIIFRMERRNIKLYGQKRAEWFQRNFTVVNVGVRERINLIEKAFDVVARRSCPSAQVYVIGSNTRNVGDFTELAASAAYNQFCQNFCEKQPGRFHYVDVDKVVSENSLIDADHFARAGYHQMYSYIMSTLTTELGA